MFTLLMGDFGTGKTEEIYRRIEEDIAKGKDVILLVPEQETVIAEQKAVRRFSPTATLSFEVSNFSRLADRAFRRVGGISYRHADGGVRALTMWRVLSSLSILHDKRDSLDMGYVKKMTAAAEELRLFSVTPGALTAAAPQIRLQNASLADKVEDLSQVYSAYLSLLKEWEGGLDDDGSRLAKLLASADNPFDKEKTVFYFDGFVSFTEPEYRIIETLLSSYPCTFTLLLPQEREEEMLFTEPCNTRKRLLSVAAKVGITPNESYCENKRKNPVLSAALSSLFEKEPPKREKDDASLRFVCADDPMDACAFIAADIARRVEEEGAKYRDFAVVARHAEDYAGLLDRMFETADVPYFFSRHNDITARRAVKVIFAAYAVVIGNYKREDVIAYLKCGYADVSQEDTDVFEEYVTRWKLRGAHFTKTGAWNMNPSGYEKILTPRGEAILKSVNRTRDKLLSDLSNLSRDTRSEKKTVKEHLTDLYHFLQDIRLEEKLQEESAKAEREGRGEDAGDFSRLFALLLDCFDALADALGEEAATLPVGVEDFLDMLRLMLGSVSLSHIPTSLDEVTVGSADVLRLPSPKHLYLLGVNENEFPAVPQVSGYFSLYEQELLEKCNITLATDVSVTSAREYFCFARAFASAADSVTMLSSKKTMKGESCKPAAPFLSLLGKESPILPGTLPAEKTLYRPGQVLDRLGYYRHGAEGEALAAYYREKGLGALPFAWLDEPLAPDTCTLQKETASALWGDTLYLSSSAVDKYVDCPFSYFCERILGLDTQEENSFDMAKIGSCFHAVMEALSGKIQNDPAFAENADPAEETAKRVAAYFDEVAKEEKDTPRMQDLQKRLTVALTPAVSFFLDERKQSTFRIKEVEAGMGRDTPLPLSCGKSVALTGRIDRVDSYEQDGKEYLRVIDYKKGGKAFKLSHIKEGKDVQLLFYLFSLWKEGGAALPAGAMYMQLETARKPFKNPEEAEGCEAAYRKGLSKSGIFLDDLTALKGMDANLSGEYVPVKLKKDGTLCKAANRVSLDDMQTLKRGLQEKIKEIGENIAAGKADPAPRLDLNSNACKYCKMKPICRQNR